VLGVVVGAAAAAEEAAAASELADAAGEATFGVDRRVVVCARAARAAGGGSFTFTVARGSFTVTVARVHSSGGIAVWCTIGDSR
jgi:hypothetical protein